MASNAVKLKNHLRRLSQPDFLNKNPSKMIQDKAIVPEVFGRLFNKTS